MPLMVTEIAEMEFDEASRILHIRMIAGAEMTLEKTVAHYRSIEELTAGQPYMALVDASNYFMIDADALKFAAKENTLAKRMAAAHYNSSVGNLLTVSFYKKNLKPSIPVGVFKTKAEAVDWLLTLEKEGLFAACS